MATKEIILYPKISRESELQKKYPELGKVYTMSKTFLRYEPDELSGEYKKLRLLIQSKLALLIFHEENKRGMC